LALAALALVVFGAYDSYPVFDGRVVSVAGERVNHNIAFAANFGEMPPDIARCISSQTFPG